MDTFLEEVTSSLNRPITVPELRYFYAGMLQGMLLSRDFKSNREMQKSAIDAGVLHIIDTIEDPLEYCKQIKKKLEDGHYVPVKEKITVRGILENFEDPSIGLTTADFDDLAQLSYMPYVFCALLAFGDAEFDDMNQFLSKTTRIPESEL